MAGRDPGRGGRGAGREQQGNGQQWRARQRQQEEQQQREVAGVRIPDADQDEYLNEGGPGLFQRERF